MQPLPIQDVLDRLERAEPLDRLAQPIQRSTRNLVPEGSVLKDALSGTWLGHPLHPVLTDLVIGSWTSAWFLDLFGREDSAEAAEMLIGIGILAAVPTAASGVADWSELRGGPRRVGTLHAAGNVTSLLLYLGSWGARRRGRRGLGVGLSMLGSATATISAFLGGHLSFRKGVGVDQTAFQDWPTRWTAVLEEEALMEGKPATVQAGSSPLLLIRSNGAIHALIDRCSHRGCSLSDGQVDDRSGTVTCPCHGSTFRLEDGTIVRGPATAPQPAFATRVRDGKIQVRGPQR
jgi:nitrite reductase/ring-hydroxylating ferredoxin subunit/uncharacterized membrane protein